VSLSTPTNEKLPNYNKVGELKSSNVKDSVLPLTGAESGVDYW
jgi:hypothetical protein